MTGKVSLIPRGIELTKCEPRFGGAIRTTRSRQSQVLKTYLGLKISTQGKSPSLTIGEICRGERLPQGIIALTPSACLQNHHLLLRNK